MEKRSFQAQVGKEVEAIEALNTYLSCHQGDAAAWYDLSYTVAAHLEETSASSNSNTTISSSTTLSKKKKGEQPQVDEKDIKVGKAFLKSDIERILKLYRDTSMFMVLKHVTDEYSQLLLCDEEA